MKPNLASELGNVLYTEPRNYIDKGVEYRSIRRIHSAGVSKSLLKKVGIQWLTLEHEESKASHPLHSVFKL